MAKIKTLKQRFEMLGELSEIMSAMKTLAYIETKKLATRLVDHGSGMDTLRAAARDFFSFHPLFSIPAVVDRELIVVLGTNRGFCGNFNKQIEAALEKEMESGKSTQIISVGDRLTLNLSREIEFFATVGGASVSEEVPAVLSEVSKEVARYSESAGGAAFKLKVLAHQQVNEITFFEPLSELEPETGKKSSYANPPYLTLRPEEFCQGLIDQYFAASLYQAFYKSLLAENTQRVMHLDSALHRIESEMEELRLSFNRARQEAIIQDLEFLMLNTLDFEPGEKRD